MAQSRFIITGILISILASEALTMNCPLVADFSLSCPTSLDSSAAAFCCKGSLDISYYCCEANEYINQHPGILAGIIIGALILILLPVVCCICCCCACCPIYQRRMNRGAVIYRY